MSLTRPDTTVNYISKYDISIDLNTDQCYIFNMQDLPAWRTSIQHRALLISAVYYGCPVYLVGSGRHQYEPRDIDIVVEMPDEMFAVTYALSGALSASKRTQDIKDWTDQYTGQWYKPPTKMFERWLADCAKNNKSMSYALMRRVDFKTQPQSYSEPSQVHGRILLAGQENKPHGIFAA